MKQCRHENARNQIDDYFSVAISLKSQTKMGSLCNLTMDFSILRDYGFCSSFSSLEWCKLSKHYKCNTVRVRTFPIIMIISFFTDKASRDTTFSEVTALYCFTGIVSHTTDLLKTLTSYFVLASAFVAIVFTVTGPFWTQSCTAVLHRKP